MYRVRGLGIALTIAAGVLAAAPQLARAGFGPPGGPTKPPFWQCPAVGKSTSCSFLIDITGGPGAQAAHVYADRGQEFYDSGADDEIVAVQNDSSAPLAKLHLGIPNSGDSLFGFEGDGLCNPGVGATPSGCPFGGASNTSDPFDYYGPGMSFEPGYSIDDGTVDFNPPLQPGQYTFFALDSPNLNGVGIPVGDANDYMTTVLTDTGGSNSGPQVSQAAPGDFTDQATLHGASSASSANGTINYTVYSDSACTVPVADATPSPNAVSGGSVPASKPVGAGLATNAVYYWQATFTPASGDPDTPSTSVCGLETMTFGTPPAPATTGVSTALSDGQWTAPSILVGPGIPVSDSAAITGPGASSATGTVTYSLYSDRACTQQVPGAFRPGEDVRQVSGGKAPASAALTLPLGYYYFRAIYSGDSSHAAAASPCGSEVLGVAAPQVAATRPAVKASGTIVNHVEANVGGTISVQGQIANAGALSARARRCGKGKVRVHGRCVSTAFGSVTQKVTKTGVYTLKLSPSAAARRALKAGHTLHVVETITLKPAGTAKPVAKVVRVTVKPPHHKHKSHPGLTLAGVL
jgi:spore coat protein U-like protein